MSDFESVPAIAADDLAAKLAEGWALVDVRTHDEWASGRIEGAVHLPLGELVERVAEVPERAVFVCAMGGRSAKATVYMQAQGREALNLDGGVQAWAAEGRALVS